MRVAEEVPDEATVPDSTVKVEAWDSGEKEKLLRFISCMEPVVAERGRPRRPSTPEAALAPENRSDLGVRCFPSALIGSSDVGGTPRYSSA